MKLMSDFTMKHALERWNACGQCFAGVLLIKRGESGAGSRLLRAGLEGGAPRRSFITTGLEATSGPKEPDPSPACSIQSGRSQAGFPLYGAV